MILKVIGDGLGWCDLISVSELCFLVNLASVDILVSGSVPEARPLLGHSLK